MLYNESRYFAEDVNGFHIRAMDKRYKYSSIESLEEFDRICKVLGLRYFAYYGTMLGAVRHKGFIPWDDDIDVIMFRKDFNDFLRMAPGVISEGFKLEFAENSAIFPLRLTNGNSIELQEEFLQRFHGCPYPTGIDIYVLDKLPKTQEERDLLQTLYTVTKYVAQYKDSKFEEVYDLDIHEDENDIADMLDFFEETLGVSFVRDHTLSEQLAKLCNRLAAIYNDTDSDIVTRMEYWSSDGQHEMMPIECFSDMIMMPFEEIMVPIPVGYDELLTRIYGDYMTPVMGGGAHEYGHYREYEELLLGRLKEMGVGIPQFLME